MQFTNPLFILTILLISVIFWRIPEAYRTRFLFIASFTYLAYCQFIFSFVLLILVIVLFYRAKHETSRTNKLFVFFFLLVFLLILKYFKQIASFFPVQFSGLSQGYMVPLGLSYLVFKLLSYSIDSFRNHIKHQNLEELLLYIFFVPSFPAGPIERYQQFAFNRKANITSDDYYDAIRRIIFGYFKKVVLVNFILEKAIQIKISPYISVNINNNIPFYLVFVFAFVFFLYAYIDLSAYADLALGFGILFGYRLSENMNLPITKSNISEYWSAWHITLSHWCRDYVYFPVLGRYRNVYLGLFASFIVMGLWHYININWLLWGLWHATGVSIYTAWSQNRKIQKYLKKELKINFYLRRIVGNLMTVIYASFSFIFVMIKDIQVSLKLLTQLFI